MPCVTHVGLKTARIPGEPGPPSDLLLQGAQQLLVDVGLTCRPSASKPNAGPVTDRTPRHCWSICTPLEQIDGVGTLATSG